MERTCETRTKRYFICNGLINFIVDMGCERQPPLLASKKTSTSKGPGLRCVWAPPTWLARWEAPTHLTVVTLSFVRILDTVTVLLFSVIVVLRRNIGLVCPNHGDRGQGLVESPHLVHKRIPTNGTILFFSSY